MISTTWNAAPAGFGLGRSAVPPYAGGGTVCPTPGPVQGTGLPTGRAVEAARGATVTPVRLRPAFLRPVIAGIGTDQIQTEPKAFLVVASTCNGTSNDSTPLGSLASRRPPS